MKRPAGDLAQLRDVQRTAVWTLHCRAAFAERGLLEDPVGISIRDQLERGLGSKLVRELGRPAPSFAERATIFDDELRQFLQAHPGAQVVSLGEGLETQRFRVDGYRQWTTVDLPDVIAMRERYIQPDARHLHRSESATSPDWIDGLDEGPTFVVAQGLFMYLPTEQIGDLLRRIDARGDATLMFDVVPPWVWAVSRLRPPLGRSLRLPPMTWGTRAAPLLERLARWLGRFVSPRFRAVPLPSGPLPGRYETVAAIVPLGRPAAKRSPEPA